ncbi:MAG: leucine--tRNA ligase [Saprospiraceae bacterium]|nr:MAG: leucine--tRNA ligase [Saprospiraceae bacterium]
MQYKPRDIEKKWKTFWEDKKINKVSNQSDKPKFYVLDMFPYPSGAGLHVGHPLGYIASDIYSRYKRLRGFNVLHPMGYDAFGLPAEQYAIQTGVHPAKSTDANIERYRAQLENLGFSFDWDRQVKTSDPAYYKWTQWIFLQLFKHWYDTAVEKARPIDELIEHFAAHGTDGIEAAGSEELSFTAAEWKAKSAVEKDGILMNYRLAYRKETYVNWCETLGTVLANDEVKDGVSERGGYPVERKAMLQWSLRITAYAERLLNDLQALEWSEAMKKMQSNWIGKSVGAQVFFEIKGSDRKIEVFTTRPDTIFGATYMVLAPEHEWVSELTTPEQKEEVAAYLDYVNTRSERDRMSDVKAVTGAFLGSYAINQFTGEDIPIWIGEYVLKDYGTGAVMAVPSDDDRDHRFAEKFDLKIIDVIDKSKYPGAGRHDKLGIMINSGFLNGMEVPDAIGLIIEKIEEMGIGRGQVNYKLRDAIYSRQRYWGEPFPIIYDQEGVAYAMDEKDLPLDLPELEDFKPASAAKSPLARAEEWVNLPDGYTRETDTMPGFAGSSWYFLRYMDAKNPDAFAGQDAINYWQDVDLYVGGTEHAVGHLMYSRFWHKFLFDKGLVPTKEPFRKLINQGMIQGIIESVIYHKEKRKFISAELTGNYDEESLTEIPVHINFVKDYGLDHSHLDEAGIRKFKEWRPEYDKAEFVFAEGSKQFKTRSEIGKMSKSKFNVVNPDDVVERYGADCFRMYEMFLGPVEQAKPWDTKGIDGVSRFLRKFWSMFFNKQEQFSLSETTPTREELKVLHQTIKKVTDDIERFSFNTCVSAFMVATNELVKLGCDKRDILEPLVILISPFAPHLGEELWHRMGHNDSVHRETYPVLNEEYLVEDSVTYPIAVNGKTRITTDFPSDTSNKDLENAVRAMPELQKYIDGKTIRRVIVVPGRMINVVVG